MDCPAALLRRPSPIQRCLLPACQETVTGRLSANVAFGGTDRLRCTSKGLAGAAARGSARDWHKGSPVWSWRASAWDPAAKHIHSGLPLESGRNAWKGDQPDGFEVKPGQLQAGQASIHYVEYGDAAGPLVVLLHGFPCFWRMWDGQLAALASAGFRVLVPDLRGYGASAKPGGVAAYSRREVVGDVKALIAHSAGGKPVHVVGHDWGGLVAWAVAADCPALVRRLAILNVPHPDVLTQAIRTLSKPRQLLRSYYVYLFQLPVIPELLLQAFGAWFLRLLFTRDPVHPLPQDRIERYVEAFRAPGAWASSVNYYRAAVRGLWSPPPGQSNKVEAPVLVMWGENDRYLGADLADPPPSLVPNCTVQRFPQATHWVMWDEEEAVNSLLVDFLTEKKSKV